MSHASEVDLSKLSAEQVKQLEDMLMDVVGGARSLSDEHIATMATQGHSSHGNYVGRQPAQPDDKSERA